MKFKPRGSDKSRFFYAGFCCIHAYVAVYVHVYMYLYMYICKCIYVQCVYTYICVRKVFHHLEQNGFIPASILVRPAKRYSLEPYPVF